MRSKNSTNSEELETLSAIAMQLCKLKISTEYAHEFTKKFSKYLSAEEKAELAALNAKYDGIYWRYWERLIKKIRGI